MDQRLVVCYERETVKTTRYLWLSLVVFGLAFFYLPLITHIVRGLHPSTIRMVIREGYLSVLLYSLFQALISTIWACILGIPAAYIMMHHAFPARRVLQVATILPFVMPVILMVLGVVLIWGNNGIVNRLRALIFPYSHTISFLYRFSAIVIIHGLYNFGIIARLLVIGQSHIDKRQYEIGRLLGAKNWYLFRTVTLPQLFSALLLGASLVFLFCFTSFGVIMVLGGSPRYATLEVSLFYALKSFIQEDLAHGIASLQYVSVFFIWFLFLRKRLFHMPESMHSPIPIQRRTISFFQKTFLLGYYFILIILLVLPLVAIVVFSFKTKWEGSFLLPLGVSLIVGLGSASFSLCMGIFVYIAQLWQSKKVASFLSQFVLLPLFASPLVISMSYRGLFHYIGGQGKSLLLVIVVHGLLSLPFVFSILSYEFRAQVPCLIDAGRSLGGSVGKVFFTIILPLSKKGIIIAGVFALALSLGELNAALLLTPSRFPSIPVAIYRLIARYRIYQAAQMGIVLLLLAAILVYAIDTIAQRKTKL